MYALGVPMAPGDEPAIRTHLDRLVAALADSASGREYLNFADRPSTTRASFDPRAWERLIEVKGRIDPADIFQSNHPVPPRPVGS